MGLMGFGMDNANAGAMGGGDPSGGSMPMGMPDTTGMTPEQIKQMMKMFQMQGKAGGTGAAGIINGALGGIGTGMQMNKMMGGKGMTGLMGMFGGDQPAPAPAALPQPSSLPEVGTYMPGMAGSGMGTPETTGIQASGGAPFDWQKYLMMGG